MKSFALLLVLPAVAYGALIFGGAGKVCSEVLVNGTLKDTVPDPDNCAQYYTCSNWFQAKLKCKKGGHFSATEKKCVDPCEAACDTTLVCTTTSAPEPSTEAGIPTTTIGVPVEDTTVPAEDTTVAAGETTVALEDTTIAAEDTTFAAEDTTVAAEDTTVAVDDTTVAVDDTTIAAEETTVAAEDTTLAAQDTTAQKEAVTSEDISGRTSGEPTETTTAFWQTIVKHFNQPPSTIPGFTGTVPE